MWRELTEDDVLQTLTAPERDAIQTAATDPLQPLPVGAVLSTVVADARGRIAAHPANRLGDGATVPETLVHHLVAIARWRLLSRLPTDRLATDSRKLEYQEALRALNAVASGKYALETPETPDDEPRATLRPSISGRTPKFSRSAQDGI